MSERSYSPANERDVVLECGCVVWGWGQVKVIEPGCKWWLGCETHPNGPGKWGMQRVLREASLYERILFREWGRTAPKRRSSRTPKWLFAMSGNTGKRSSTEPEPTRDQRLF